MKLLMLAPMAGWTDLVYRGICKEFGADLTFTEMISAVGLAYGSEKTFEYLALDELENKVGVQLFGSKPDIIAAQAAYVQEILGDRLAVIDINMGCPARKIIRKGEGSALMDQPDLAAEIVKKTVAASDGINVSVKFRKGFHKGLETAPEFAKRMEDAGASALCIHGRFASDLYRGQADWTTILRVKQAVSIPVAASGDLFDPISIAKCFIVTGADAAMIARGAQGNPWIFPRTAKYLSDLDAAGVSFESTEHTDESVFDFFDSRVIEKIPAPPMPSTKERIDIARYHARKLNERDEHLVVKMRTYASAYFKGIPGAVEARREVIKCKTLEDFEEFFDALEARLL